MNHDDYPRCKDDPDAWEREHSGSNLKPVQMDATTLRETDDWAMRTARITLKHKREAENTEQGFTLGMFADLLRTRLREDPPATKRRRNAHFELATASSDSFADAEAIYAAYPRKVAKKDAIAAILKALSVEGRGFLLARTQAYANAVAQWPKEDQRFIPHPATWFNRGSYADDPKEWNRGTPNQAVRVELAE